MGLAHGGMRQKNFNFYEEAMRVPLVYSNPRLFPQAAALDALVSHVDFLPTLASLFAAPQSARATWEGKDYSRIVLRSERRAGAGLRRLHLRRLPVRTGDGALLPPPNHIVSIRETRWKLAKYYDAAGTVRAEREMYDLKTDPLETTNLARRGYRRTPAQNAQYARLRRKLAKVQASRLQPL